jgi:hypothetical protein
MTPGTRPMVHVLTPMSLFCLLGTFVATASGVLAEDVPKGGNWPRTLPGAGASPTSKVWDKLDIEQAQARCVNVLRGLDVVAIPAAPLRDGDCGAPAPIELVSVGASPQVTFSPPVIVTCELAAAMHNWIRNDLQPIAKRHLGTNVIRIDTMSSYSCRNAYGRSKNKLSEHGKANAIDVRGFMTAKSDYAEVLSGWGPTARDIQARVLAARLSAEKAEQQRAGEAALAARSKITGPAVSGITTATVPNGSGQAVSSTAPAIGQRPTGEQVPDLRPSISIGGQRIDSSSNAGGDNSALGLSKIFGQPSRLGGPKTGTAATASVSKASGSDSQVFAQFLRAVHVSACKSFGTTLGPEANDAHRNHFHLDLAERKTSNFCE